MAKGSRSSGKMVTKTIGGSKAKRQDFPLNTSASNALGDKKVYILHYILLVVTVIACLALIYWGGAEIYNGAYRHPIAWWDEVFGAMALASVFFVGRGLFWISVIGPTMLAARSKAWQSQEELCRRALKYHKVVPGGGLTAALILVQSLVSRGQFAEAIAIAEEQHKRYQNNAKMAEALGPMYSAISVAHQVQGDAKQSITWGDRAIEAYNQTLKNYTKKKSWLTKMAEVQGGDIAGNIRTQLTVAFFNNASNYFNQQNFRSAKVNFQKTLEAANQAPEFPEKGEILRACKDGLSRLKHH